MRSGNVLHSKSEYNRCWLPRLTINQDSWLFKKKEDTPEITAGISVPEYDWDVTPFLSELGEDATAWKLGSRKKKAEKRKISLMEVNPKEKAGESGGLG